MGTAPLELPSMAFAKLLALVTAALVSAAPAPNLRRTSAQVTRTWDLTSRNFQAMGHGQYSLPASAFDGEMRKCAFDEFSVWSREHQDTCVEYQRTGQMEPVGEGCCRFDGWTGHWYSSFTTANECVQACSNSSSCVASDLNALHQCFHFEGTGSISNFHLGCGADVTCWRKKESGPQPFQWMGFQGWPGLTVFGETWIQMSFYIKFFDQVPESSSNFGIKVQGQLENSWVDIIRLENKPGHWFYVSKAFPSNPGGDADYMLLIFDSASDAHMKVQVLGLEVRLYDSMPKDTFIVQEVLAVENSDLVY